MANERITEDIVRSHFKSDALWGVVQFDEQFGRDKRLQKILQHASKSGTGRGKPEFLITFPEKNFNHIIVIECKPKTTQHASPNLDKPKAYAVDGALHYAAALSDHYDVIAIAVSGTDESELKISTYHRKKGSSKARDCGIGELVTVADYLGIFNNETFSESLLNLDIVSKAVRLNEDFHSYSITEGARNTLISAVLLALLDDGFKASYSRMDTSVFLANEILAAVDRVLTRYKVRNRESMINEFQSIRNEPLFKQKKIKRKQQERLTVQVVKEVVDYIERNVHPLMRMKEAGLDVLGNFYTEFIRYAGSSQKQGLVLTPAHVTDLFCDLAGIKKDSVVYDPCCGSGGFLIAAMKRMLAMAPDEKTKARIKSDQLVGVETRADMFTYACTNMIFRGDGRSNLHHGDSFALTRQITKNDKPDIVFLNPPYDQGNADQLRFVENGLSSVAARNGIVVAIVQMSCAVKRERDLTEVKERLLARHRLLAVISMPDDLFYPVAVPTCIMVWQASTPNEHYKTWFGYLKHDGFEKRKHKGRVDAAKRWPAIKESFLRDYRSLNERSGQSVRKEVSANDEWCAEAYLKTDYAQLTKNQFEEKVRQFLSYRISRERINVESSPVSSRSVQLDVSKWKTFKFGTATGLFNIVNGYYNRKPTRTESGDVPFIGATEFNNGVTEYFSESDIDLNHKDENSAEHSLDKKLFAGKALTVSNNGSVGCAFYQSEQFTCSHDINVLYLKHGEWNPKTALFIATVIELEKYRWAYGRKWRPSRMPESTIDLPVDKAGKPDWKWMESFMDTLAYSRCLGAT